MGNEVMFFGGGAIAEKLSFKCFSGKYSSGGKKGDGSFNKVWKDLQIIAYVQ